MCKVQAAKVTASLYLLGGVKELKLNVTLSPLNMAK
jgi:hypothetical protein